MTTKHAAALAALDAGVLPNYNNFLDMYQPFKPGHAFSGEWYNDPIDALAAAAEALGLEVRYVVLPRGRCTRCGRYASDERRLTIIFDEETDTVEGIFCAEGCGNSEEEKPC